MYDLVDAVEHVAEEISEEGIGRAKGSSSFPRRYPFSAAYEQRREATILGL
jgi:hypothetical protein